MDNDNFYASAKTNNDAQSSNDQHPKAGNHSNKRAVVTGLICGVAGLAIGAAGVFGLSKLADHSDQHADCDCPTCDGQTLGTLDYDFLKLESASDNIIYSPLSIKNGLALLNAGAAGTTKSEITKVLGDAELPKYNNIPDVLSLANAVFIRDTFKDNVLPTYTSTVENDYNAEVIYDNFASSDNMDKWVDQKTFGLINQIGIVPNEDTEMVLANALAIQMDWQHPFSTDDTSGRTFYQKDGSEIEATTMRKETSSEDIKYFTDDTTAAISMPLDSTSENVNLDFIAIMPSGDLDTYIKQLDSTNIDNVLSSLTPASEPKDGVVLTIPKFKFDYQLKFKEDLEALGIKTAFGTNADFTNMASKPLRVSQAVHKANIDFSEDGIKAAAVTAFAMVDNAMAEEDEPTPVIINIDHPFLFLIRDKDNGTVWFTGAVYQPNLWSDDSANYR